LNTASKFLKKIITINLMILTMLAIVFNSFIMPTKASGKTGEDMANWALNAYYEGWVYSWGGTSPGAVDCSGLIASFGVGGARYDMMGSSDNTGDISSLPEIPGLGLYMPGHVGVYIGNGMAVDARDYGSDMCYQSVSSMGWTNWFEISGIDYGENIVGYATPTAASPFNNFIRVTGIDKLFASIGCQTGLLVNENSEINLNTVLVLCFVSLLLVGSLVIMFVRFRGLFASGFKYISRFQINNRSSRN